MLNINKIVAGELGIRESQVAKTMELIDAGDTITFIARYRKEVTGDLETEILFKLNDRVKQLRELEARKETVIRQIEKFGKLTQEVVAKVRSFTIRARLDEYYEGFIPREDSEGTKAIALGLQPVADAIKKLDDELYNNMIHGLVSEKGLNRLTCESGARHIVYEELEFDTDLKDIAYELTSNRCSIEVRKINKRNKADEVDTYDMYSDFTSDIKKLKPHNTLAILRGVREKQLNMEIVVDDNTIINRLISNRVKANRLETITGKELAKLIRLVYMNVYKGKIASEIKKKIGDIAEERAVDVFAKNLYSLLMQKPVKGKILGIDPGIRTGTKLALIDENGVPMSTAIIKPLSKNKADLDKANLALSQCIGAGAKVFAIGNGTASKENVNYVTAYFKENNIKDVNYVVVSEAGASIYSTSETAKKEFPNLDEYQISSITIARRLQDPLAELVKLDPKTLGVGQYQHDIKGKKLDLELNRVVETCVNRVGVNLNTASPHLLMRVSGLNAKAVNGILQYRAKNKRFNSRKELLRVEGVTPEIFKQSAGFLRVYDGENRLDSCFVHPENYEIAEEVLKLQDAKLDKQAIINQLTKRFNVSREFVLDIISSVNAPMYDVRQEGKPIEPIFRNDVISAKDINIGDKFTGTVRSVTDFGAFIDIGIHQDVLLHISQISDKYIKDIHSVIKVGQTVNVTILNMDENRRRIGVTMLQQKEVEK